MIKKSLFKPAWWARNRHLQTILPRHYTRPLSFTPLARDFHLPDGDFVELVLTHELSDIAPSTPVIFVFHGLTGSFDSTYAKGIMNAIYNRGWAGVFMHFRSCGQRLNKQARAYHSGETTDANALIYSIKQTLPDSPLGAIGFSLGGNMLTKYLGESHNTPLDAAAIVSAPLCLANCSQTISQGFSKVYENHLLEELKTVTKHKISQLQEQYPDHIDHTSVQSLKTIREFDDHVTAPVHDFINAEDYYKRCSGKQFLKDITVPTLIMHAKDDPFMGDSVIPVSSDLSPSVVYELSDRGGHVGFITGKNPFKPEFWYEKRTLQFFEQHLLQPA